VSGKFMRKLEILLSMKTLSIGSVYFANLDMVL
jgi:hypothetical protein